MGQQFAKVQIWHNPECGTSRQALAHLHDRGVTPDIYLYATERPSRARIEAVLGQLGLAPSQALRADVAEGEALGVYAPGVSEDAILDFMAQEPLLVQRPIVLTEKGAVIARPKAAIAGLIDAIL